MGERNNLSFRVGQINVEVLFFSFSFFFFSFFLLSLTGLGVCRYPDLQARLTVLGDDSGVEQDRKTVSGQAWCRARAPGAAWAPLCRCLKAVPRRAWGGTRYPCATPSGRPEAPILDATTPNVRQSSQNHRAASCRPRDRALL